MEAIFPKNQVAIADEPGSHRLGKVLKIVHDVVEASLLAINDVALSGLWIDPVQRAVYRQFGEHDDLLDRQCVAALQAAEFAGEVAGHGTGAGQRFVGVG